MIKRRRITREVTLHHRHLLLPSQRTPSSPVPMAKAAMEASSASSNEESLIAELELVLADLRMSQENCRPQGLGYWKGPLIGERYGVL